MDKERMRTENYAVRYTWKEKTIQKKRPEINKNNKMSFENQKVLSTNHNDFILILKTDTFPE